jgi:POT family proton-dependent oligopeptide transporter
MNLETTVKAAGPAATGQRTFLGHPIGLYILFFTEMWERFSYYGMRALLIPYMVIYFRWLQQDASAVYKWYTSLVYLTPLIGGFLADRYLGNKRAVVIGAALMAIGHFLMAFEPLPAFFSALVFLIIGNGFFKPNMSTQVGRLYPPNDPRRDGAYTIFYMGINLGAFLSPLACGWLAENTMGRYHSGFTLAGIGMVAGLVIYVVGLPWVKELKQDGDGKDDEPKNNSNNEAISEQAAARAPSALPRFNRASPALVAGAGVLVAVGGPVLALLGLIAWNTVIALEIAAVCAFFSSWILSRVSGALRDRVLAIYVLGIFVVCFWAAFEQAGNALNLWADQTTNRYLTRTPEEPRIFPLIPEETGAGQTEETRTEGFWDRWINLFKPLPRPGRKSTEESSLWDKWVNLWNPVPTAWFQAINALAIVLLAPLFAFLWVFLARRNLNPSTPTKMALGLVLMGLGLFVMIGAASQENMPSDAPFKGDQLPEQIGLTEANQLAHKANDGKLEPYHAGRLIYDPATRTLQITGVLTVIERDRIVGDTAPPKFVVKIEELQKKAEQAKAQATGPRFIASVQLDEEPPGFDMRYAGFPKREVNYDPDTRTLTTTMELAGKDIKALRVAAGDPQLRDSLNDLMVRSSQFKVSSWWLFWSYILATLGELCLSPVGLSMVSKLSPAKFATMLMGLWLLTSFFGGFAAGAFGELWGTVAPTPYFWIFVALLGGAAVVLFLLVRKVVAMMHGVN